MALNIKNARVESLAAELARMTGETKTEVIRRALEDRRVRLSFKLQKSGDRVRRIREYLEKEVWPSIPPRVRKKKISKAEREAILGIGPGGYPE
jgi:antitoxin VapB